MNIHDSLYGSWKLPEFLEKLIYTKEMVRARRISQAVLPNYLMPHGPIPSRFEHGLGVARLASIVVENNPELADLKILLPVAGLLHDAGNTALSHLGEHFLRQVFGKNGEEFLEDILAGSETEKALASLSLTPGQVVDFVTGNLKPLSDILNGSLDIDNLDNVGRYMAASGFVRPNFDAAAVAGAYRFTNNQWVLPAEFYDEICRWKDARSLVYRTIYSEPHLSVATMIHRACELACEDGLLNREFFLMNDDQAIEYLSSECGVRAARIVDRALRWDWYQPVHFIETTSPTEKFKSLVSDKINQKLLADRLAQRIGVSSENVAVYAGKGRDRRMVTVPFVEADGSFKFDKDKGGDIYRLRVYLPRELLAEQSFVIDMVSRESY